MARRFDVKGTNEYKYWAIGLAAGSVWCALDGWFPRASVLEKHPDFPDSPWQLLFNTDHFYDFNRTTCIIFAVISIVLFFIHRRVR